MYYFAQLEVSLQTWHNLLIYEVLHLERNTWKRDYDAPILLEPHTRSCTVSVVYNGAALWHHCLASVEFVEGDISSRQHCANMLRLDLIVTQRRAEVVAEGVLCDIVFCRA